MSLTAELTKLRGLENFITNLDPDPESSFAHLINSNSNSAT